MDVVVSGNVNPLPVAPLPFARVPVEMAGVMPVGCAAASVTWSDVAKLNTPQLNTAQSIFAVITEILVDTVPLMVMMPRATESAPDASCIGTIGTQQ
jgi:hypothetical protein